MDREAPQDLGARLRARATARPDGVALSDGDSSITWAQLDARVDAAAAALQGLGVGTDDRVALVVSDGDTFVEVAIATARCGGVLVPLLVDLAPDELRHALSDSGARVVVAGPPRAAELRALGVRARVIDTDSLDDDGWRARCREAGRPTTVERGPDDLAVLFYTSGTSGRPRGAMLTRANLAANQDQSHAGRLRVTADDVVLVTVPLAHVYAFTVGLGVAITAGATLVAPGRVDPPTALRIAESTRATAIVTTPAVLTAWLDADDLDAANLSALRIVASGASPLGMQTIERFRQRTGRSITEGYGLTEASPSVAATSMTDDAPPGSVGLPLPGVEIRLVGEDGSDVVGGDVGEIWVRGPNVFRGWWNDARATARSLTEDGWLRTGDAGTRDEHGMLYLVDRLRDLVIVDGFSVFPGEVERVVVEDLSVHSAAVVGTPHPVTGEAIVAYVVAAPGATIDVDALMARCSGRLARYKCPARIEVVDALPYTASGKVRRMVLRDES
ncbi:MAG: AMP-binding protein [Nitriliruptoraceae bacterium]